MGDMNKFGGIDTSGLNEDTFGISNSSNVFGEGGNDAYETTWSSEGSYHVPGYENVTPEPIEQKGRGLEIATLVFGILSLVLCCCNGMFAFVGLILGIVALAKGRKTGVTIAGIVCSVIGLFFAFIMFLFSISDVGQEFQDAFMEGYESATEEYADEQSNDEKEYTENSVKSYEGTVTISDKIAGKVVIDGKEIFVPCQLSELLAMYEVSDYSQEDMKGGLGSYESKTIFFAENGVENGLSADAQNYTETELAEIEDANIGSISIDENFGKQVEVFGGLVLGMTEAEVEEWLSGCKYNKSEMSGYIFYNAYAGEDSKYSVSLMLSDGVVINITLYYSGL